MMKKLLFALSSAALFTCTAGTVLLDHPKDMDATMKGIPDKTWNVRMSKIVPAKPNTWYRASVEIKTALKPGSGNLRFRVLHIGDKNKSLVFSNIAVLQPSMFDFAPHSGVFLSKPGCKQLRVYYQLSKVDGTASFRNLKLEELSEAEAEKIRAAYSVPPAYFSPAVYAWEGEKELPWGYRITTEFLKKEQIPAKIVFSVPQLKVQASQAAKPNTHAYTSVKLAQPLKKGKYTVVMTALDASGKELAKEERILRVIARPKVAARLPVKKIEIDADGNTVINGKPVLINGVYHVYSAAEGRQVADAGFNTVIAWEPESKPEKYLAMLEWIKKYDMYADCVIKWRPPEVIENLLKVIGKHPTIIAWDPEDEPNIKDITVAKLQPKIAQLRKLCPGIPMRISCAGPDAAKTFGQCAELIGSHSYVIPFGGLQQQVKCTETVVKSFPRPRKHSPQMTLQSWVHWHDLTRKPQTPEQTRSLAYISLIGGAKGLWWYSFIDHGSWDVRSVPSLWTSFKGLNAELADLNDVILTGKRLPIKIEVPNAKAEITVVAAVWQLPDRTVLAAVNTMKEPATARISGLPGSKMVELYADDAVCAIKGGTAEFTIPPETTRVFEIGK